MTFFDLIIRPVLFSVDAEKAHYFALKILSTGLLPTVKVSANPSLKSVIWKKEFNHPIGLAAGFDKDAIVVPNLHKLGFSFIEVGTVTPQPQFGNPKPRIFRLFEDRAIINRLGFNSIGLDKVSKNLEKAQEIGFRYIVGVNLGKNRDTNDEIADYVKGISKIKEISDYIVINISSPNTLGLRDLQKRDKLPRLLGAVLEEREKGDFKPPILLKVAPDLDDRDVIDISKCIMEFDIDGLIATNTTLDRAQHLKSVNKTEGGGLSGHPLFEPSNKILSSFYRHTGGNVPIVGSGGVFSGKDAYMKIRAGASLVQIYTAMVYCGPNVVKDIVSQLGDLMEKDGFGNIKEVVGVDVKI